MLGISAISDVGAANLENTTISDGDGCNSAGEMGSQDSMNADMPEIYPIGDDFKTVGGDCDHINEINAPTNNWTCISVIVVENRSPTQAKIDLSQSGSYFGDKKLTVKVLDNNSNALYSIPVTLKFSNGKTATVITKESSEAIYELPFNPGTYSVNAKVTSNILDVNDTKLANIKIKNAPATITLKKLSTSYKAKKYFQIKVTNSKTKKRIEGVKLLVKVYSNGKAKKFYLTTDSNGIAKFSTANLDVGLHKVKVSEISKGVNAKAKTSQIKVGKAPTTFLDEVGAVYIKKGGVYNIAVFNKNTEKPVKGVKLTVKIYNGNKVNKYVVKTGKYGADIDLGHLGLGTYKVTVSFDGNSRYKKCTGRDEIDVIMSCGHVIF